RGGSLSVSVRLSRTAADPPAFCHSRPWRSCASSASRRADCKMDCLSGKRRACLLRAQQPSRLNLAGSNAPVGSSIKGENQQHGIASRRQNRQRPPRPAHTLPLRCPEQRTLPPVSEYQVHVASKMHESSSSAQSLVAEGRVIGQDTSHTPPKITKTKITLWG